MQIRTRSDGGADEVICTGRFDDDTNEAFLDLYSKIYAEEHPMIPHNIPNSIKAWNKHRVEGFLILGLSAQNLSLPEKSIDSPSIPQIGAAVKYFFS